ncbi:DUF655 domain-containing protein [Candidatus Woesearchaeota archaeon]|nr:DUF655 domain-containing protein [Candidatus Woesearchaeota archaeon]
MQNRREETAIVLDFLLNGYSYDNSPSHLKTPIVQALGINNFTILELVPRKGIFLQPFETVYVGQSKRDKIHHINGRIPYTKLTSTAKAELEHAVKDIVHKEEKRFIEFFNEAKPLNTRIHTLEFLPGVGKKHMMEIIEERRDKPFSDFKDLKQRVKLIQDPEKLIVKRIVQELEGKEKYNLFVSR